MITDASNEYKDELFFMDLAFEQAKEALKFGEVPVGCVFVYENKVIASGRNAVNVTHNATRHAEMLCIDGVLLWANKHEKNSEDIFKAIDIYVTVEPCAMCADALGQLKVRSVTYGCSNERFGGCGSIVDVPKIYNYGIKIKKDVDREKAIQLLKEFYKGENPNTPFPKAKRKNN